MEILMILSGLGLRKTKPNKANIRKVKRKKAKGKIRVNPELLRMVVLKKQSQFSSGQIGVKSYMKGKYEETPRFGRRKNKANQSMS